MVCTYDILYNPAVFTDANTLNPFSDRKIREATNWLYDRNYINQEIYGGGSLPKWFTIQTDGADYADLADVARGLESYYSFNIDKANTTIAAEMTTLGATLADPSKAPAKAKSLPLASGFFSSARHRKYAVSIESSGSAMPRSPTREKKIGQSETAIHASIPNATVAEKILRTNRYATARPSIAMKAEVNRSTKAFAPSTANIPAAM